MWGGHKSLKECRDPLGRAPCGAGEGAFARGEDAEVLGAGGAQLDVVAGVVVHARLGQHGVVLDLGLAQGRRVVGDDDPTFVDVRVYVVSMQGTAGHSD